LSSKRKVVGGSVPKEFIPGVEKGLEQRVGLRRGCRLPGGRRQGSALSTAPIARRRLLGAGLRNRRARRFREALQKGGPVLLEPIMKVEVVTPEDIPARHRRPQFAARPDPGQDMRGNANVINAMVPLANMFGYVNNLRSMSQGRATLSRCSSITTRKCRKVSPTKFRKFA
jgi:elongation factor G